MDESEVLAIDLMIMSLREAAEEEAEERGINPSEIGLSHILGKGKFLRDTYEKKTTEIFPEVSDVSPALDKRRREAVFRTLCILRFVRQGFTSLT